MAHRHQRYPRLPRGTPVAFYEQLAASRPDPVTGKPDPAKMKAFLERHPETVGAVAAIHAAPMSSGFYNATYNSLDAFRFVDAAGRSHPCPLVDGIGAALRAPPLRKPARLRPTRIICSRI